MLPRGGLDAGLSLSHQGNHTGLPLLCKAGSIVQASFVTRNRPSSTIAPDREASKFTFPCYESGEQLFPCY
ncbi:MAG: hypothetical protein ACYS6K_17780 [Planctomycetota bacterium]